MNKIVVLILVLVLNCKTDSQVKESLYPDECLNREDNCHYVFENYPSDRKENILEMKRIIK